MKRDAGDDELKKTYRKLALRWHPGGAGGRGARGQDRGAGGRGVGNSDRGSQGQRGRSQGAPVGVLYINVHIMLLLLFAL